MKTNFQIKLSAAQERQALVDYEKYIQQKEMATSSESEGDLSSDDETEEDKSSLREYFRLLAYHKACLSRIYKILKNAYGKEFAQFASKIDKFGDLEAAEQVTKLIIQLEQMLSQGTTKEAVQEKLNPFSSQYQLKALEVSERQLKVAQATLEEAVKERKLAQAKAEEAIQIKKALEAELQETIRKNHEADAEFQATKTAIELYNKQLEALQAAHTTKQTPPISETNTFLSDNTQIPPDDLKSRFLSLNAAYGLLQDNVPKPSESHKTLNLRPSP